MDHAIIPKIATFNPYPFVSFFVPFSLFSFSDYITMSTVDMNRSEPVCFLLRFDTAECKAKFIL